MSKLDIDIEWIDRQKERIEESKDITDNVMFEMDTRIRSLLLVNEVLREQVKGLMEGVEDYQKQSKALESKNE